MIVKGLTKLGNNQSITQAEADAFERIIKLVIQQPALLMQRLIWDMG